MGKYMSIRLLAVSRTLLATWAVFLVTASPLIAAGDEGPYTKTLRNFREQPAAVPFFEEAVGYAVFPTIGKGGIGIGGAYGSGRVYKNGEHVGNVKMGQVSIGFQLGGQAYSEIIFFQNEDSFAAFTNGDFEFGADVSAVALTAGAQASATTKGATASAGTSAENTDTSAASWYRGMAVFTMAKGGLMYQASIGGQGFDYQPLDAAEDTAAEDTAADDDGAAAESAESADEADEADEAPETKF
jgi:lipid-binding SYLF domain-containing protein